MRDQFLAQPLNLLAPVPSPFLRATQNPEDYIIPNITFTRGSVCGRETQYRNVGIPVLCYLSVLVFSKNGGDVVLTGQDALSLDPFGIVKLEVRMK
jgi:hypothetical protein